LKSATVWLREVAATETAGVDSAGHALISATCDAEAEAPVAAGTLEVG